jgi:hypothetical protein
MVLKCLVFCRSALVLHNSFCNYHFIKDRYFKFDTGVYPSVYNNMYEFHYSN